VVPALSREEERVRRSSCFSSSAFLGDKMRSGAVFFVLLVFGCVKSMCGFFASRGGGDIDELLKRSVETPCILWTVYAMMGRFCQGEQRERNEHPKNDRFFQSTEDGTRAKLSFCCLHAQSPNHYHGRYLKT
jgi:hypothetical protein